ncbi:MAG: pyridoxamine 5'-phosphate oxidase family protein [Oscillospiraceae bacterium]
MRKKERQVIEMEKIKEIMQACIVCHLGFAEGKSAYVVPLNFGFEEENGKVTLFFHGSKVGRKIDLINKMGWAGFEMDTNHAINSAPKPCDFSYRYQSIIGEGKVDFIEDKQGKVAALEKIMSHYEKRDKWEFDEKMLEATAVFKLQVEKMECKEHR